MSSITDKIHENYTTNVTFAKIPVNNIIVMDDVDMYVYTPQDDITGIELAHLLHLFVTAAAAQSSFNHYDYWGFVKEKNLTRHFTKK